MPAYDGQYVPWIVALSVLIAISSSVAAFEMSARVRTLQQRLRWLPMVALVLGAGIWAMHFIGMTALRLQCAVDYDLQWTLVSMLPGIVSASAVLWLDSRPHARKRELALASVVLAAGIGGMHYSGMSALRFAGLLRYELLYFLGSLAAAGVLSYGALWLREQVRLRWRLRAPWPSVWGGLALGAATSSMHYLAMAGTVFVELDPVDALPAADLSTEQLVLMIAVLTSAVVAGAQGWVVARAKLVSLSQRMDLVLRCSHQGFAAFDAQGRILECNPALAELLGRSRLALQRRDLCEFIEGLEPQDLRAGLRRTVALRHSDGRHIPCEMQAEEAVDSQGTVFYAFAWFEDITERRAAEEALRQEHERSLSLSQRLQTLLDHSGQGFLVVNPQLRVEPGANAECARLFGGFITGKPVVELLAPNSGSGGAGGAEELERCLHRVFDSAAHPVRQAAYLDLLPAECQPGPYVVTVAYRVIDARRLMLILTDTTETVALRAQARAQQQRVEYLVRALEHQADMLRVLQSWRRWSRQAQASASLALQDTLQQVHTFKGLFAQEAFPTVPAALHRLESLLTDLPQRLRQALESTPDLPAERWAQALHESGVEAALAEDLALLQQQLGLNLESHEPTMPIALAALDQLDHVLRPWREGQGSLDAAAVDRAARRLFLAPLSPIIRAQMRAAQQLATHQGKRLAPLDLHGPEVWVDVRRLAAFTDALVHLFRNAVDHGLEWPDERHAQGKPPEGRLRWRQSVENQWLHLSLEDDGRGIDVQALRDRALELGCVTAAALQTMDETQSLDLVFHPGLSTREGVGTVSGRGIGLSALRSAVTALDGRVVLESAPGQGARMRIAFPLFAPEAAEAPKSTLATEAFSSAEPTAGASPMTPSPPAAIQPISKEGPHADF